MASQQTSKKSTAISEELNPYLQNLLPKVRSKYHFGIMFNRKLTDKEKQSIVEQLTKNSFEVKQAVAIDNKKDLFFIGLNNVDLFYKYAYILHIQKMPLQPDQQGSEKSFTQIKSIMDRFQVTSLDKVDPRIRQYEAFQYVTQKTQDQLIKTYPEQFKTSEDLISYFSPSEQIRIIYSALQHVRIDEIPLFEYLQKQKLLNKISPLHIDEFKLDMSIPHIEQYFGEDVSIYYKYLEFYQKWLLIPAILGLLVFLSDKITKQDKYKISVASYVYAFITVIWFTMLIVFWKRKESEIAVRQQTLGQNLHLTDKNPEFKGDPKINLVTGMPELHYPKIKRIFQYFYSFLESIPLLILTTVIKLIILNLNGSIQDKTSIFYVSALASLTQEGSFISSIPQYKRILNLITVLAIQQVSKLYITVSKNSTDKENHKTNQQFKNSLIFKRFFFELINRFFHYFYVAFAIHDLKTLKDMLFTLFLIDEFRKVFSESIMPILKKKLSEKKMNKYQEQNSKKLDLDTQTSGKILEMTMSEYDNFGDYVEVVFQMFYCTVFACVFPLSATLSYVFNIVEMYSDKYKLVNKLYLRNIPMKVVGIGMWVIVMNLISLFSVYSNITFMAFNSFNYFHTQKDLENKNFTHDSEWSWEFMILVVFVLEHAIIIVLACIRNLISSKPKWVRLYLKRKSHKKMI